MAETAKGTGGSGAKSAKMGRARAAVETSAISATAKVKPATAKVKPATAKVKPATAKVKPATPAETKAVSTKAGSAVGKSRPVEMKAKQARTKAKLAEVEAKPATSRAKPSATKATESRAAAKRFSKKEGIMKPWLASYPPGIPHTFEYPEVPLTRLLDDSARNFPNRTALIFEGNKISYADLADQVGRFAGALSALGVRKGDRVGILLPNCPQNVIAFFAILRLGAIVVQNNPLYTERELQHQFKDSGLEVLICLDLTYERVRKIRKETALRHVIVTSMLDYLPGIKRVIAPYTKKGKSVSAPIPAGEPVLKFLNVLRSSRTRAPQAPVDAKTDLALLQYTGGTTGVSKGVMLTHYNLVANATQGRLWLPDARDGGEVTLCVLPFFHSYGLTVCQNIGILLGATLVLLPRFEVSHVLEAIQTYRPTLFPGVPTMYVAINNHPDVGKYRLNSIRACLSGAAPLPVEVQEQFEALTGGRLVEGFGLTETSPMTHANPVYGKRKIGTIGLPFPDTDAIIVDSEDPTKVLGVDEPGELAIKGPQVMSGYWNRPDETAKVFSGGWFLTGDMAKMDAEGYFSIVDRKKDMIIAGGYNIYPRDIEEVLFEHPKIREAVVVGIPDPYRGETVKAYIVLKEGASATEADILDFCKDKLAAYKVPKMIEFREELPKTMVGKVLRRVLLEEEKAKAAQAKQAKQ
ncbi:MAG: AMP-binding protein [Actinomycetota bacterium]